MANKTVARDDLLALIKRYAGKCACLSSIEATRIAVNRVDRPPTAAENRLAAESAALLTEIEILLAAGSKINLV